jgi:hypothetical protein
MGVVALGEIAPARVPDLGELLRRADESVKSTVARTRSSTADSCRTSAKKESMARRTDASSPAHGEASIPGSSTSRAPGIRSARNRADCVQEGSSALASGRTSTSVGTWIEVRMGRTSVDMHFRAEATAEPSASDSTL